MLKQRTQTTKPAKMTKQWQKLHDRLLIEQTQRCQNEPIFDNQGKLYYLSNYLPKATPNLLKDNLFKPQKCYVCKQPYTMLHPFYHRLCPSCADKNYAYRQLSADLTGRIALVTGGRIKIGFEIALKLLRAGATVIVTTRFVQDAIARFSKQADFADWHSRLHIYGLDLKYVHSVELFAQYVQTHYPSLDILINNSAQTLRKPPSYYEYRALQEIDYLAQQPDKQYLLALFQDIALSLELQIHADKAQAKRLAYQQAIGNQIVAHQNNCAIDEFAEPIDFSPKNSWVKSLDDIDTLEFLEVQMINATAPFILTARLKNLMRQSRFAQRFIINVSAMEGQFNRENKTCKHPHTNMAKASLNMMTRTVGQDYAQDGIYMNSVDTGWVTQENPFAIKQQARLRGMIPPLDCIDGAARVLAPIFDTLNTQAKVPQFGQFLKDYDGCAW